MNVLCAVLVLTAIAGSVYVWKAWKEIENLGSYGLFVDSGDDY